jgi:hypothetical protein
VDTRGDLLGSVERALFEEAGGIGQNIWTVVHELIAIKPYSALERVFANESSG